MTAEDLRKSILQQAIQGKLVPQDPNDEPASKLLERIREEKARLVKEKKIKKDKKGRCSGPLCGYIKQVLHEASYYEQDCEVYEEP